MYQLVVFFHVIFVSAFVMTVLIMQLVVTNAMKRIPDSPSKKEASLFIQKKWVPVVDFIIIMVGITGVILFILGYQKVMSSPILQIKIILAVIVLTGAYLNHFILRTIKRKLASTGDQPERLKSISKVMMITEKMVLILAPIIAILGWYFNHIF